MSETPKKKVLTREEWLASRMVKQSPEISRIVGEIETLQDKDSGKQAVRVRLVVGGKVVAITLLSFEQLEQRGQWVPSMTFIRGNESVEELVEIIESKGAELPPEQKSDK